MRGMFTGSLQLVVEDHPVAGILLLFGGVQGAFTMLVDQSVQGIDL